MLTNLIYFWLGINVHVILPVLLGKAVGGVSYGTMEHVWITAVKCISNMYIRRCCIEEEEN